MIANLIAALLMADPLIAVDPVPRQSFMRLQPGQAITTTVVIVSRDASPREVCWQGSATPRQTATVQPGQGLAAEIVRHVPLDARGHGQYEVTVWIDGLFYRRWIWSALVAGDQM